MISNPTCSIIPGGLIQVHGDVTYDEFGVPTSLTKVDQIIEVDESSIEIHDFVVDDTRYRVEPPLQFSVSFDREDQLYDLDSEFDVNLSAESLAELEDALGESLVMLWTEYAQEETSRLSPKAQELKMQLSDRCSEIQNGV